MPRSPLAYLSDIVEACEAIEDVLVGVDLDTYKSTHPIRSAVEREFILIGEAVGSPVSLEPDLSDHISHARMIVGFRNQLAHDYAAINDAIVWAIAANEVPVLKEECRALIVEREAEGEAD